MKNRFFRVAIVGAAAFTALFSVATALDGDGIASILTSAATGATIGGLLLAIVTALIWAMSPKP